jgi:hypothetical protein
MAEPSAVDRGFFRTAEDGTTVFFPWGFDHRGYRLPDPEARKRASRAVSLLFAAAIAIGTWAASLLEPFLEEGSGSASEILGALALPGAVLAAAFAAYWLWVTRFVETLHESDLRVSREERLREAAAAAEPRKLAGVGLVLCGLSALLIGLQPHAWWLGLLGIVLGAGLTLWSRRLRFYVRSHEAAEENRP